MPVKTVQELSALQNCPSSIRNISILAHVDHGKTTLADALIASNGIISQRMAGKMRYMDSREDEQERGITMKSSAISLYFQFDKKSYLVNLIDSPGHVDFSSEVSTAVRLCEGAIVMVDVVEGVCPQTHAVLRQAWLENIRPVLVLNKIDRLICELKMSPHEAFLHLLNILVQVNLLTNQLFTSEAMLKLSNAPAIPASDSTGQSYDWTYIEDEEEGGKNIFFSPDRGNVVFASALDGWGFTISHFAKMYSSKLGISQDVLQKTLWGDYYVNMKTKRILKGAQSKGKKPLFVQFALDNIWAVYEAVVENRDKEMTEKIIKSLDLKVNPRDMRHHDPRVQLHAVTSQWLPVSEAVLSVVVQDLPSPLQISEERVEKLMCRHNQQFHTFPNATKALKADFIACSASEEAPVIVFVSKMFPVENKVLPRNKARPLTEEELQQRALRARQKYTENLARESAPDSADDSVKSTGEDCQILSSSNATEPKVSIADVKRKDPEGHTFIAFARIFSGQIRKGQRLYVLGPKHSPSTALAKLESGEEVAQRVGELGSDQHITSFVVSDLYMFMGRELEQLDAVPAGNIIGIGGLDDHILKSATVSSTVACPAFTSLYFDAAPILRVAIEPAHPSEMGRLVEGLRLLNQADPCVQVLVQETGEHVIVTAGEVHLQRCVDDLRKRYARVEVNVSKPIVPFRETIIPRPTVDRVNEAIQDQNTVISNSKLSEFKDDEEVLEEGLVEMLTPNRECVVRIRALPLPAEVVDCILNHQEAIKTLDRLVAEHLELTPDQLQIQDTVRQELLTVRDQLREVFSAAGPQWVDAADCIWSFGPKRCGPNILLNKVDKYQRLSVWSVLERGKCSQCGGQPDTQCQQCGQGGREVWVSDSSVIAGFQMATQAGPLCEEPMLGVAFLVEQWGDASLRIGKPKMPHSSHDEDHSGSETSNSKESSAVRKEASETTHRKSKDNETEQKDCGKTRDCSSQDLARDREDVSADGCVKKEDENVQKDDKTVHKADADAHSLPSGEQKKKDVYGPMSGQIMSVVKDGCRKAFQTMPQRLMQAMYECTILSTSDILGKLYAVIGKRNGRVTREELIEGTQMFKIVTEFPVVDSFGLSEEMRKRTSGLASPQLRFSHWQVLDLDPFWVPSTEEEYLHYGEKADNENRARVYMNEVRRRKGLQVDEKIVEFAEKQRTLTRNK